MSASSLSVVEARRLVVTRPLAVNLPLLPLDAGALGGNGTLVDNVGAEHVLAATPHLQCLVGQAALAYTERVDAESGACSSGWA